VAGVEGVVEAMVTVAEAVAVMATGVMVGVI